MFQLPVGFFQFEGALFDLAFEVEPVGLVLANERGPFQGLVYGVQQHGGRDDGLDQIVPGAKAQRFHRLVEPAFAGNHQHGGTRRHSGQPGKEFQAVHDRHLQVDDEQVRPMGLEHVQPFLAVAGLQDGEPTGAETGPGGGADERVIVHHQDGCRAFWPRSRHVRTCSRSCAGISCAFPCRRPFRRLWTRTRRPRRGCPVPDPSGPR